MALVCRISERLGGNSPIFCPIEQKIELSFLTALEVILVVKKVRFVVIANRFGPTPAKLWCETAAKSW